LPDQALFVNAAILTSRRGLHRSGIEVAAIEDAYKPLSPLVGAAGASTLFAIALLPPTEFVDHRNPRRPGCDGGLCSSEGHALLRCLTHGGIAIVPTIIVVALRGEHGTEKLLLRQVILLQLSFAVIPLVIFTGIRKDGRVVNAPLKGARVGDRIADCGAEHMVSILTFNQ
jgi:manganese transport protein